jgi:adenosylmethionine-8-amino-7-oxononanoate aminotransferase
MKKKFSMIVKESLEHVWHPCSRMADYSELNLLPIKSGDKSWLIAEDGKKYFDSISSWWVNLFGHNNPFIKKRIIAQLNKIEHVMLSGMTHEPVVDLSRKLKILTNLDHCFYSSDGSSAVEIALKISFHYWKNKGFNKKTKFAMLSDSYHGETIGALSVTDVDIFSNNYKGLLLKNFLLPNPSPKEYSNEKALKAYALESFEKARVILEKNHNSIAGLIIEPIVQCASGMNCYHPVYLKKMRQLCKKLNIHLIADEIAVGFGRTGKMFACEHASINPDILCLSKGLSGGYLPLAATLVCKKIYNEFLDAKIDRTFLHSHSFTGNPLACSAALATLDFFEDKKVMEALDKKITKFDSFISKLNEFEINNYKNIGMIWRFDLPERFSAKQFEQFSRDEKILLRPIGQTIYFMPPLSTTIKDIKFLVKAIRKVFIKLGVECVK